MTRITAAGLVFLNLINWKMWMVPSSKMETEMDRELEIDLLSDNELDVVSGGMQAAFYYGEQVPPHQLVARLLRPLYSVGA